MVLSDPLARIELEIEPQARGARAAAPADPGEVIPPVCTLTESAAPSSAAQALAMLRAGLGYLTSCDAAELGTAAQAEALIGLEQAEAQHTAARAKMLAAFSGSRGITPMGSTVPRRGCGPSPGSPTAPPVRR